MAPDRFSWRLPMFRKRGFPDKDIVRVALSDAVKGKYGRLVKGRYGVEISGRSSDGWHLTTQGVKWIHVNERRITGALRTGTSDLPPREVQRFSSQTRKDPAFQAFAHAGIGAVTPYMFVDFLGCSPDASIEIIQNKYERLRAMAELAKDRAVIAFLQQCHEKFTQYFKDA